MFTGSIALLTFNLCSACSPHLIGQSEPEGLSGDGIGVPETGYCGVLYITSSPWD